MFVTWKGLAPNSSGAGGEGTSTSLGNEAPLPPGAHSAETPAAQPRGWDKTSLTCSLCRWRWRHLSNYDQARCGVGPGVPLKWTGFCIAFPFRGAAE